MTSKKDLVIAVFVTFCLTAILFNILPIIPQMSNYMWPKIDMILFYVDFYVILPFLIFCGLFALVYYLFVTNHKCSIPYCERMADHLIVSKKIRLFLCAQHYCALLWSFKDEKAETTAISFFNQKRMRRIFNPNTEEKVIIDYLVKRDLLTPTIINGKSSYKPTKRFTEMVENARTKLFSIGYILDYERMFEQSIRIAVKQSLPEESFDNILKYSEIVFSFVFLDSKKREIDKLRLWKNKTKPSKITYIV